MQTRLSQATWLCMQASVIALSFQRFWEKHNANPATCHEVTTSQVILADEETAAFKLDEAPVNIQDVLPSRSRNWSRLSGLTCIFILFRALYIGLIGASGVGDFIMMHYIYGFVNGFPIEAYISLQAWLLDTWTIMYAKDVKERTGYLAKEVMRSTRKKQKQVLPRGKNGSPWMQ